jgi:hypothetical protein
MSLKATARCSASNPPTASKADRRTARQAAVVAETHRAVLNRLEGPGARGLAPTPRAPATPAAPIPRATPACCTRPSGKRSIAPAAPTSGRRAWAARAFSQLASRTSTSLFRKTRRSPVAAFTAALLMAE